MSPRLEQAIAAVTALPLKEQEDFADRILADLEERRWAEQFRNSPEKLRRLADEGRAEYRAGLTRPLDELL